MASENQPAIIESSAMYRNNICGQRKSIRSENGAGLAAAAA
jgi:hypothetical protein